MIKPKAVIIKDVIVYDFSILDIGFLVISQYKKRNGMYINNENPSKYARVVIMIKINASNAASSLEESTTGNEIKNIELKYNNRLYI